MLKWVINSLLLLLNQIWVPKFDQLETDQKVKSHAVSQSLVSWIVLTILEPKIFILWPSSELELDRTEFLLLQSEISSSPLSRKERLISERRSSQPSLLDKESHIEDQKVTTSTLKIMPELLSTLREIWKDQSLLDQSPRNAPRCSQRSHPTPPPSHD